jgi:hypothetical protein
MSKIDQLRRQREEQHERQEQQVRAPGGGARAKSAPVPAPVLATRGAKQATALEGACSVCGKTRELANGLVSNHQKGLGKMCPGSRKEPA